MVEPYKMTSALIPRLTKYIPYPPTIRQQAALCMSDQRELLYGGAAGGGKSDWLLMEALQFADCPDYSAILFRRTFKQLADNDALLPLAMEWLSGTDAQGAETMNGYPTRWDFPSGAVLSFSHMQLLGDRFNHQGARYNFVGVDELTQFLLLMYTYLFSRLRRSRESKVPIRMRGATNPGGEGADWVQLRFGIPNDPIKNLHRGPNGRLFLPARLEDNPHLDREEYLKSLDELDPVTRAQLLAGDWSVRNLGGMIKREWFEIVEHAPDASAQRLRYWDRAATKPKEGTDPDWTVGTLYSKVGDTYYIEHVDRFRDDPTQSRDRIKQRTVLDGRRIPVHLEIEPGSSGKSEFETTRSELAGYSVHGDRPTGKKPVRAGPCASAAKAGKVKLVRGDWIPAWLDQVDQFPIGAHDDDVDSWSGAHKEISKTMSWSQLNADPSTQEAAA